ncbi:MAG TPA: hypothetical protein VIA80_11895 [Hyphomonadaceae bacterium]
MRSLLIVALALAAAPAFAAPPSVAPKQQFQAPPLPAPPAKADPFDLRTAPQLDNLEVQNRRRDMTGREPYRVPQDEEYRFQFCTLEEVVFRQQCEQRERQQPRLFLLGPELGRYVERAPAAAPLPPPCEPAPTANARASKPAGPAPCPAPR